MKADARPIRVALLTEIISPYRIPFLNELASDERIQLEVFFFSTTEGRRNWRILWEKINFQYRILPGLLIAQRYQGGPIFLNPTILGPLRRGGFDTIICFGYHHPTIWLALMWSRFSHARALLWSESTLRDERYSGRVVQWLKRYLLRYFDGFVAAGAAQVKYLRHLGAAQDHIWVAPDAVDSDFFSTQALHYWKQKTAIKQALGVEGPIVLCVGRLLDAKGIPELLDAFEQVSLQCKSTLLLVGDGPDRVRYQEECRKRELTSVYFVGFQSQQQLPRYYAIADVFVFPTRSDPWGLVLNEAMCSGLPVICSTAAGGGTTLVRPGKNGFLHEPGDVGALRHYLLTLLHDSNMRSRMGAASREIIVDFTPKKMASGFLEAVLVHQNRDHDCH